MCAALQDARNLKKSNEIKENVLGTLPLHPLVQGLPEASHAELTQIVVVEI